MLGHTTKSYKNKTQKTTDGAIRCLWLKLSSPLSGLVFKHVFVEIWATWSTSCGSDSCSRGATQRHFIQRCNCIWSSDASAGAVAKPASFSAARALQVAGVCAELPNLAALPEGGRKCTFSLSYAFSLAASKRIGNPLQVIKLMQEPLRKSLISAM